MPLPGNQINTSPSLAVSEPNPALPSHNCSAPCHALAIHYFTLPFPCCTLRFHPKPFLNASHFSYTLQNVTMPSHNWAHLHLASALQYSTLPLLSSTVLCHAVALLHLSKRNLTSAPQFKSSPCHCNTPPYNAFAELDCDALCLCVTPRCLSMPLRIIQQHPQTHQDQTQSDLLQLQSRSLPVP